VYSACEVFRVTDCCVGCLVDCQLEEWPLLSLAGLLVEYCLPSCRADCLAAGCRSGCGAAGCLRDLLTNTLWQCSGADSYGSAVQGQSSCTGTLQLYRDTPAVQGHSS
jgi:hypothetical protein